MFERRKLPALDKAKPLKQPDLFDIGNKNYTDTILKYGGLATRFSQLKTNAKTLVEAINELFLRPIGSSVIPNPEPPGEFPALTTVEIDQNIYQIEGGGSNVIPNPPRHGELPDLVTIKIDDTDYDVGLRYVDIIQTLEAGESTLVFTSSEIKADSTLDVYTDTFGVNPIYIATYVGSVQLVFDPQSMAIEVKLRIW